MQLVRHPANPVLTRNPANPWEAGSVLNATVLREEDGLVRMLYRATNDVQTGVAGRYVSCIGYAESRDGVRFHRRSRPLIVPDQPYEQGLGCEDPRVTRVGEEYFIYYTAVRGFPPDLKVRIALATTKDFRTVTKHGIVGPAGSESKAAALLAEPVGDRHIWYYTWCSDRPASTIMHARFASLDEVKRPPAGLIAHTLEHYDEYAVLKPERGAAAGRSLGVLRGPELGPPPVRTEAGWLLIYCGTDTESLPEWQVGAALLDRAEPWRVIAKTAEPILRPQVRDEVLGVVDRVTFPSGAMVDGDQLYVYYGSGDQGVCLATCRLRDLLDHLVPGPAVSP